MDEPDDGQGKPDDPSAAPPSAPRLPRSAPDGPKTTGPQKRPSGNRPPLRSGGGVLSVASTFRLRFCGSTA